MPYPPRRPADRPRSSHRPARRGRPTPPVRGDAEEPAEPVKLPEPVPEFVTATRQEQARIEDLLRSEDVGAYADLVRQSRDHPEQVYRWLVGRGYVVSPELVRKQVRWFADEMREIRRAAVATRVLADELEAASPGAVMSHLVEQKLLQWLYGRLRDQTPESADLPFWLDVSKLLGQMYTNRKNLAAGGDSGEPAGSATPAAGNSFSSRALDEVCALLGFPQPPAAATGRTNCSREGFPAADDNRRLKVRSDL